jgi:hypothetical protein
MTDVVVASVVLALWMVQLVPMPILAVEMHLGGVVEIWGMGTREEFLPVLAIGRKAFQIPHVEELTLPVPVKELGF